MSYILEALKKSEHEREQAEREQQGSAKAALSYDQEEPKKGRNYGALILLVLVVNIALGAYVFFTGDPSQKVKQEPLAQNDQVGQKPLPMPKPKPVIKPESKKIAKVIPKPKVSKVKPATGTKPKKILRSDSNKLLSKKQVGKPKISPGNVIQIKPGEANKTNPVKKINVQPKQVASIEPNQAAQRSGRLPVPPEIDTRPVKKQRKVAQPKGLKRTRVGVEQTNTRVVTPKPQKATKPASKPKVIFSKVELTADPNDVPGKMVASSGAPRAANTKQRRPVVPNFMDMDPDFRRTFPKIDINVHVYDPNPDDRFALIEMKRYSEGDTLSGGIVIKEITPEGFVVVYKRKTFLYPAK